MEPECSHDPGIHLWQLDIHLSPVYRTVPGPMLTTSGHQGLTLGMKWLVHEAGHLLLPGAEGYEKVEIHLHKVGCSVSAFIFYITGVIVKNKTFLQHLKIKHFSVPTV